MARARDVQTLRERLPRAIPEPRCELEFAAAWQLLVATILSAQSTDARKTASLVLGTALGISSGLRSVGLALALALVAACQVPLGAPGAPVFEPLVSPAPGPRPTLAVTMLLQDEDHAALDRLVLLRALRTSGLFVAVEAEPREEGSPAFQDGLEARISVESGPGPGWRECLALVFSVWREEVRLELELVDARGQVLFGHAGVRSWTVLASPLLLPLRPFTSYERRDEALHELTREALRAALADGALGRAP